MKSHSFKILASNFLKNNFLKKNHCVNETKLVYEQRPSTQFAASLSKLPEHLRIPLPPSVQGCKHSHGRAS